MKARQTYSLILLFVIAGLLPITGCKNGTTGNDPSGPDPQGEAPAIPSGLTADAGDGEIILSWNANSEANLSHYNVYQGETSGTVEKIGETPAGTETYTAEGLTNGSTYYFAINAENDDGQVSEMTGEINATPVMAAPERLEASWIEQFGTVERDGFVVLGLAQAGDGSLWAVSHLGAAFEGVGGPFVARFDSENGTMLSIDPLDLPAVPILPHGIAFTIDGGYIVAGYIQGELPDETRTGVSDVFLAKYDNSGAYVWGAQLGVESKWTEGQAITISESGDIYVTGNVSQDAALPGQTASGGGRDVFLIKFSPDGENEWIRQFGNGSDRLWSHGVSMDGEEVVVMGTVADEGAPLPGSGSGGNAFIRRYSDSGDELSTLQLDIPIGTNEGGGMVLDNEGLFWVFGSGTDPFGYGGAGGRDFILAQIDLSTGSIIAAAQIGTPQSEWGDGIALGSNGEVYAGGATNGSFSGHTNTGDYDIAIARFERP